MRRPGFAVLFPLCLLLLSGCGPAQKARQLAAQIADFYVSVRGIDARIAMIVNRGSLENDFILEWQYSITADGASATDGVSAAGSVSAGTEAAKAGQSRITIASPQSVAGIRVEATADGNTLYYDGAVLTLSADGTLAGAFDGPSAPSPLAVLPLIFAQWREGGYSACAMEALDGTSALALTYRETRGEAVLEQRVWFDAERLTPLFAELSWNGRRLVTCRFETFTLS